MHCDGHCVLDSMRKSIKPKFTYSQQQLKTQLLGFLKSSVVSLDEKHILQELKILMPHLMEKN
jgi:hypothetical protein